MNRRYKHYHPWISLVGIVGILRRVTMSCFQKRLFTARCCPAMFRNRKQLSTEFLVEFQRQLEVSSAKKNIIGNKEPMTEWLVNLSRLFSPKRSHLF